MDILLLHGALGSRSQLDPLAARLAGHSVRAIDLSGHGTRPVPGTGLSFDHFLQDIAAALDEAGRGDAHLFGYSMGGYAALLYAARHPQRVRSVVTLGTKLRWDREGLDRELRLLDPQRMQEKVPHFTQELARQHGADRWADLVRATARSITELHERPLLPPEVLAGIACPVLLCVGDGDRTAVPEHTLAAARHLPRAGTLVLPRTGHPMDAVDLALLLPHLRAFWVLAGEE